MYKKILLSLLTIACLQFTTQAQVAKKVFIEHFTNNSSGPSASQNSTFYSTIISPNSADIVHIAFHTNSPGNDVFYSSDPNGVTSRYTLYGSTNIPYTAMNGRIPNNSNTSGGQWNVYDGAPSGYTQTAIDNEAALTSPLSINTTHSFNTDYSQVDVSVVIKNESGTNYSLSNQTLYVSLVNEELNYNTAPNSNGETQFLNVHRLFLPDENGQALSGTLNAGDSVTYSYSETTTSELLNLLELKAVAFVQNTSTLEVIQAGESNTNTTGTYADLTISDQTTYNSNLCDSLIAGTLNIQNTGTISVDSFEVEVSVNGVSTLTEVFANTVAAGSNINITTTDFEIDNGTNSVSYEITQVYGNADVNAMNNSVTSNQVVFLGYSDIFSLNEGFESDNVESFPENPAVITSPTANDDELVYVVDESVSSSASWNLGAFEESNQSLLFDFYSSGLNEYAEVLFGTFQYAIPIDATIELSFDYAYAQRSSYEDEFYVLSTSDCGTTWDTLFAKTGGDLITTSTSPTGKFWPESTDWDSVQLYPDVPLRGIKFVGKSDRGSMLFLDNVSIDLINSTSEIKSVKQSFSVFPNPAKSTFQIKPTTESSFEAEVYSMSGQLISKIAGQGITEFSCSDWSNGIYFIHIRSGNYNESIKLVIAN